MTKRISWVDYAKGIGILLVVLGHVIDGLNPASHANTNSSVILMKTYDLIYGFHMPLFFLLSGLFVERSLQKDGFFKQKLLTIVIPYFIWSLFQGVTNVLLSGLTNSKPDWSVVFLIPIFPYAQFWFLYALFICFAIYFLMRKTLKIKLEHILIISLLMYACTPFVGDWFGRITEYFVYLVMGSLIYNKRQEFNQVLIKNFWKISVLFLVANAVFLTDVLDGKYLLTPFKLIIAIIGISLVISVSSIFENKNFFTGIKYLGSLSMQIFLMHTLASAATRILLTKFFGIENIWIHLVLGCITGVALPIIAYYVIRGMRLESVAFGQRTAISK